MGVSHVLSDIEVAAIRQVRAAFPTTDILIVGAAALARHVGLDHRHTDDLDLALAIGIAEFPGPLASIAGWSHRPERAEHRFRTERGLNIDILPAAGSGDALMWPSGFVMSLVGFDLAFLHAERVEIEPELEVLYPPATVIALLKINAWLDRPHDRQKDLHDLRELLLHSLADDDERHWTEELVRSGLPHERHAAYALGLDVARIALSPHRELVLSFLRTSPEHYLGGSVGRDREEAQMRSLLDAFRRGLEGG